MRGKVAGRGEAGIEKTGFFRGLVVGAAVGVLIVVAVAVSPLCWWGGGFWNYVMIGLGWLAGCGAAGAVAERVIKGDWAGFRENLKIAALTGSMPVIFFTAAAIFAPGLIKGDGVLKTGAVLAMYAGIGLAGGAAAGVAIGKTVKGFRNRAGEAARWDFADTVKFGAIAGGVAGVVCVFGSTMVISVIYGEFANTFVALCEALSSWGGVGLMVVAFCCTAGAGMVGGAVAGAVAGKAVKVEKGGFRKGVVVAAGAVGGVGGIISAVAVVILGF